MNDDSYLARGDFVYRVDHPVRASSAEGCRIFDHSGNDWIDLEAANGALFLGYDKDLVRQTSEDWARLPTVPSFVETEDRLKFSRNLGAKIFKETGREGRLAFENSGAQGIELALRIASNHQPTRRTILVFAGGYHGRSIFCSSLSSSHRYRKSLGANGYRIVRLHVPDEDKIGLEERQFLTDLACRQITSQEHGIGEDALALVFEPVLNVSGLLSPGHAFLNSVIKAARSVGATIIADEIFTGYHKLGPFLSSARLDNESDLIVVSKAITNGYTPMSAVWGVNDLMHPEKFKPGEYSTTFSNSPVNFMLANRVLEKIESLKVNWLAEMEEKLDRICRLMLRKYGSTDSFFRVRGATAFLETPSPEQNKAILDDLRSRRILVASTGLCENRILFHPPVIISDGDIQDVERRLAQ